MQRPRRIRARGLHAYHPPILRQPRRRLLVGSAVRVPCRPHAHRGCCSQCRPRSEAAAASPRALLRSPSRLDGLQGCWDGPRAEGAASARLRTAMGAPCSRTSGSPSSDGLSWVRLLLCVEARKRRQAVRRSGKSRTDVWRWGEQLGRAGGRSIARDMRARPRSVGARSVLNRCRPDRTCMVSACILWTSTGHAQARTVFPIHPPYAGIASVHGDDRVVTAMWCNRNLLKLFWTADRG